MVDTSSATSLNSLSATLMILCVFFVGLRLYIRKLQSLPWGIDDLILIPCLAVYVAGCIIVFVAVDKGVFGYSTSSFTKAELKALLPLSEKLQISRDIVTNVTLACVKLSALFFYRRIFCVSKKDSGFSILTIILITTVSLWLVVFCFLTGFQCGTHFSALWNGTYEEYCTLSFPMLYGLVISNVILDILIILTPMGQIAKLHTSIWQRLAISGIFLTAAVGLGASIARMAIYIQIENAGPAALQHMDHELTISKAVYFSVLEGGMSLIAVNLPSLWFLFSRKGGLAFIKGLRSMLSIGSSRASSSAGSSKGSMKGFSSRNGTDTYMGSSERGINDDLESGAGMEMPEGTVRKNGATVVNTGETAG